MAKWLIRVTGNVPRRLEIEAPNQDEAENDALNEVYAGLDITVEPLTGPARLYLVAKGRKKDDEPMEGEATVQG